MAAVLALVFAAIGFGSLVYANDDNGGGPQAPAALGSTQSHASAGHTKAHPSVPRGVRTAAPTAAPTEQAGAAPTWAPVMARSLPLRVDIPSVRIDSSLLRLGLNADGSLQVPWKPLLAGWYQGSPTPGELGPAIIAGHVDSWATGPAVFYRLGQVVVGAHVLVTRADSSVAHFQVTAVRSYPKNAFPTQLVYGDVDNPELRLMTCADWNATTKEYDGTVIVFARLVRT